MRETAATFRRIQPGGFILFGRNIQSPAQLRKLIDDLRDLSRDRADHHHRPGRRARLAAEAHRQRAAECEPAPRQGRPRADRASTGAITGRLLRMFGFNLDLCPVLDISFDDEADNSLRGRCYGNDVAQVIRNAGAFNDALRAEGILSCGKHFPGYSRAPARCAPRAADHPAVPRGTRRARTRRLPAFLRARHTDRWTR